MNNQSIDSYFSRETLPEFLTKEKFESLDKEIQDFIVLSSRMQYFLQSKIDLNNVESIVNRFKYQMEITYQSIVYQDSIASDERKDHSAAMESLELGVLNAELINQMQESYSDKYMKLRIADWMKK